MAKVLFPNDNAYKWQGKAGQSVFGSGFSVPSGIEALLQYNGLVMNDKSVLDKYYVTSIDGLDDADVRDTRENKPQDDGEDSYGSLYSGRTIVLNIRVEAYQLNKLRDMEEALRTAFVDISKERPLYFVTGDPMKDHFIMVKKSAKNQKSEDVSQYQGRFFRDWSITLRASDFRFYRNRKKFLGSFANTEDPELNKSSSGFPGTSLTSAYSLVGSFYSSAFVGTSSVSGGRLNLSDFENALLSTKVESKIKPNIVYRASIDVEWYRDNFLTHWGTGNIFGIFLDGDGKVISTKAVPILWPGLITPAREIVADFQAPNNNAVSSLAVAIGFNTPNSYPTDSLDIKSFSIKLANPDTNMAGLDIINEGNYNTYPVIRVFGGMNKVNIVNDNGIYPYNNIRLKDNITIAPGDFYEFNIKARTITNSNGVNKINDLHDDSGWLRLVPGINKVHIDDAVVFSGSFPQLVVEYRDSWV